jgi:small-conductance mechanosensitive channel
LLWSEPFRIEDQIRIDDYEGTVEEIQARATVIRTYDGRRIVVPNADLFTKSVTVNTAYNRRRWEYDLSVGDVEDVDEIKSQLLEAIGSIEGVLSDPTPQALVLDLGDSASSVKLRVWWWTEPPRHREMLETHDRVLTTIRSKLRELGHEHSGSEKGQLPPTSDSATAGKRKDAA